MHEPNVLLCMRSAALPVVLLLAACGGAATPVTQVSGSPSATVSGLPSVPPSLSPSPSPAKCDLPVWLVGHGGFVTYPGGAFAIDPASTMVGEPGGQTTDTKPQLHGYGGESYDRQFGRWLPVDASQVSPDGVRYAYFDVLPKNPSLLVVDVATGTSRVVFTGDPRFIWAVVAFRSDGIYVSHSNGPAPADPDPNRLWRLELSGALSSISDRRSVGGWRVAGGYAWAVETDDPSKLNQLGNEERLLRVDLSNGATTIWLRRTGTLIGLVGVEPDGSALVLVSDPLALWKVAGPGTEQQVPSIGAYVNTISDSHGVWLSNQNGIWLITAKGEVLAVSPLLGIPAGECG